jgi:predicted aconitase with swiveling domain
MNPSEQGEMLVAGPFVTSGEALVLTKPISFWGGVDAKSGRIADPRHPQYGESVAGRALFLPGTIGSSSASSILLELVRAGAAPAALILHEPDAILLLGLIVAREMGWRHPPAVRVDRAGHAAFAGRRVTVRTDGRIEAESG